MTNILTVDVEDWQQSTLDPRLPVSERVLDNTHRLLGLLAEFGVRATFFVQTRVAEKYPELIACILGGGHEIGSHGHDHVPLFDLTPDAFAEDLDQSLRILRSLGALLVLAYRAPDFSLRRETWWALPILRAQGIRYDSSIFPFRGKRYGVAESPLPPHPVAEGLVEVPLSVVRFAGRNWPVAGGGYLRLLPYALTRRAIRRINAEGRPAVVYLHPYELDTQELQPFRGRIPWRLYFSQNLNRRRTEGKLRSLLGDFSFAPLGTVLAA